MELQIVLSMKVLITGAAHGIGKATAERLVERGHKVIAYDINQENLDKLPDAVNKYHGDVYDENRLKQVMEQEEFSTLVNCAGFQEQGSIEDMEMETIETHFKVNVFGTIKAVKTALPTLREKNGKIINMSSLAGRATLPYLGAYCGSKFAVEGISASLRQEVAEFDVDVVTIQPGPIKTGFNQQAKETLSKYLPDSIYSDGYEQRLQDNHDRHMEPEKAAKTMVRAIEAGNPKSVYTITWQAWTIPKLKAFTPTKIWDHLARSH